MSCQHCNSDEACGHEEEGMPIRAVDHYPRTPIPESSFEIVDGVVTELDCRAPDVIDRWLESVRR